MSIEIVEKRRNSIQETNSTNWDGLKLRINLFPVFLGVRNFRWLNLTFPRTKIVYKIVRNGLGKK